MPESSTTTGIPLHVFKFSGQSTLDSWTLTAYVEEHNWSTYKQYLRHEPELCFERIRELADAFPTYQRQPHTGRKQIDERTHLIAMLLKQFLEATYAELESYLTILQDYFDIPHVPSESTLSRKNRSDRFQHLLTRFHRFILDDLPKRDPVIATDATGYNGGKRAWRNTHYGQRAEGNWTKVHAAVEIPCLLYLNTEFTEGRVHESQRFTDVWDNLPNNIDPKRSLADNAYTGEACLTAAREHGATPLHDLRKDHRYERWPDSNYERLINFATHWPNRFEALTKHRKLIETAFHATKAKFGDRLKCRDPTARENEIMAKQLAHNIRMLVMRAFVGAS